MDEWIQNPFYFVKNKLLLQKARCRDSTFMLKASYFFFMQLILFFDDLMVKWPKGISSSPVPKWTIEHNNAWKAPLQMNMTIGWKWNKLLLTKGFGRKFSYPLKIFAHSTKRVYLIDIRRAMFIFISNTYLRLSCVAGLSSTQACAVLLKLHAPKGAGKVTSLFYKRKELLPL